MHYICNFQLLFLGLKLVLLVDKLLAKNALLIVEVEEDAEILCQFIVLLSFDDSLNFKLLGHLLANFVDFLKLAFLGVCDEALLLLSINLRLKVLLLPHLLPEQRLMVLVKLARLPKGHL